MTTSTQAPIKISLTKLRQRGWSNKLIADLLGEPDETKTTTCYIKYLYYANLATYETTYRYWNLDRVLDCESRSEVAQVLVLRKLSR